MKVYDTHPLVLSQWLSYLQMNAVAGVAMKAVVWRREKVGFGTEMEKQALGRIRSNSGPRDIQQRVQELAEQIIAKETGKQVDP